MAEEATVGQDNPSQSRGFLDARYNIQNSTVFEELSTEVARAHPTTAPGEENLYALVYDKSFPSPIDTVKALKEGNTINISKVIDYGKITLSTSKTGRFAVILKKPTGKSLTELFDGKGYTGENFIVDKILPPLINAINSSHEVGFAHGNINPDNIYFDSETSSFTLREGFSEYCGFSQDHAFESVSTLSCDPAGKGDYDFSVDFFAVGMVLVFLLSGQKPFRNISREELLGLRLSEGSFEVVDEFIKSRKKLQVSNRMLNLLRGLLTESKTERWDVKKVNSWLKQQDFPPPQSSAPNRQEGLEFIFDDKEYFSLGPLLKDLHTNWDRAKTDVDYSKMARWVTMSLKRPNFGEKLEFLAPSKAGSAVTDEKLARILIALDPEGPIRFKNISVNIYGFGSYLSYLFSKKDQDKIALARKVLTNDIVEYWINQQSNPDEYTYVSLGWSPMKTRQYAKNSTMCFGMERCLYETNKTLSCQSPVLGSSSPSNLQELLTELDVNIKKISGDGTVDDHITAFIGSKIDLTESVSITTLNSFPKIAKNQQLIELGVLTMAQQQVQAKTLPNIASHLKKGLDEFLGTLHNKSIKKTTLDKLKVATKTGNLSSMFKVMADPVYIRKDIYGFHEAKKQYFMLSNEIIKLQKQSNIRFLAYQYGLRISVTIAYISCLLALWFSLFSSV